jgi:hypothetical protein
MEIAERFLPHERVSITEQGRYDLIFCSTCQCEPKLSGLIVTCRYCGTVYGHLNELDKPKRARPRGRF